MIDGIRREHTALQSFHFEGGTKNQFYLHPGDLISKIEW